MRFLFIAVLLVGLLACNPAPPPQMTATFGQQFSLKLGQTAKMDDGLLVTFEDVPSDGRCSSCTASFLAVMNLRMTAPGQPPALVVVKTPPFAGVDGAPPPYTVKYINLQPQHNTPNDALNRADYVVTLMVTKTP